MSDPMHHIHKRKRIHQKRFQKKKYQPYPHPNGLKRIVDHLIYGVSVFVPAMTAIQAVKIWTEKDASGISLYTWGGFALANIIWILYGFVHKEYPIILMYILLFIFHVSIVIGTLLYG